MIAEQSFNFCFLQSDGDSAEWVTQPVDCAPPTPMPGQARPGDERVPQTVDNTTPSSGRGHKEKHGWEDKHIERPPKHLHASATSKQETHGVEYDQQDG